MRASIQKRLHDEYAKSMAELRSRYEQEQQSKTKLENDLSQLREQYETEMARTAAGNASSLDESEARRRLAALEQQLVGGEQANNEALKQKRFKKIKLFLH